MSPQRKRERERERERERAAHMRATTRELSFSALPTFGRRDDDDDCRRWCAVICIIAPLAYRIIRETVSYGKRRIWFFFSLLCGEVGI